MNRIYCFFAAILFSIPAGPAFGQILNIEKNRFDSDTGRHWKTDIGLQFDYRKQQTGVLRFSPSLHAVNSLGKNRHIFISELSLVKVDEKDAVSYGFIHLRSTVNYRKRFSPELFVQLQYDDVRGMQHRILAGAGLHSRLAETEKYALAFAVGAMAEKESWTHAEGDTSVFVPKFTSYLNLRSEMGQFIDLNLIAYYQSRFDYFLRPRLSLSTNFSLNISTRFSFLTKFTLSYDHAPVVPIDKLIYRLSNGIQIKF